MEHVIRNISLGDAWVGIQKAKPGIRIREAAKELGVSEAELLATKVGNGVIRLQGPWQQLLKRLPELRRVMSLTRNDSCVLEHKGTFQKVEIMGEGARSMATVIGPIEQRVFFGAWQVAFAVVDEKPNGVMRSIQVFDKSGEAILKVYLQDQSDTVAYEKIIKDFTAPDQMPYQVVTPYPNKEYEKEIDEVAFLSDWETLKDTHDFFSLLRKYNVSRFHALEIATGTFSYPIDPVTSARQLLEEAAGLKLPIMIFAGNRGNIQIHQGNVRTIKLMEKGGVWLNVLDPDFNLHLRQDLVCTAWVVKKPTVDGVVTAVELFDKKGELIVQFFGLRKPGIAENQQWRSLVDGLPRLS